MEKWVLTSGKRVGFGGLEVREPYPNCSCDIEMSDPSQQGSQRNFRPFARFICPAYHRSGCSSCQQIGSQRWTMVVTLPGSSLPRTDKSRYLKMHARSNVPGSLDTSNSNCSSRQPRATRSTLVFKEASHREVCVGASPLN